MTATIICPLFHGAKNVFVARHFILRKIEDLPRQARDTHTGKVEGKRDVFSEGWSMQVRKRHFLSHLYIKINILPRQARDKHRENSKKVPFSLSMGGTTTVLPTLTTHGL
jgi:hypothetical protein